MLSQWFCQEHRSETKTIYILLSSDWLSGDKIAVFNGFVLRTTDLRTNRNILRRLCLQIGSLGTKPYAFSMVLSLEYRSEDKRNQFTSFLSSDWLSGDKTLCFLNAFVLRTPILRTNKTILRRFCLPDWLSGDKATWFPKVLFLELRFEDKQDVFTKVLSSNAFVRGNYTLFSENIPSP